MGYEKAKALWSRAIILVDMNAFFASIEQRDNPHLRNRPVAVTNGSQGTCIITCSYEARRMGVKTGMRLNQARSLCPELVQCPAQPKRYAQVSRAIMLALHDVTPDVEVFSVDEAFLDVTACQKLHGTPEQMAKMTKEKVFEASGLLCSVGVSGDKTTAKFAAKLQKPDGLVVIEPWLAKERLRDVPVTQLCGIGEGIGAFLAKYGVYRCGEMENLPISVLARRFGDLGRRIWYMCQGADPEPMHTHVADPKSMGHGKVMPPNTRDERVILTYLMHMSEKLAARMRRHDFEAQHFFIGMRNYDLGWIGGKARLAYPSNDGKKLFQLCHDMMLKHWHGIGVSQVQLTALDPKPSHLQLDFFEQPDVKQQRLNKVIDAVNNRYGELHLAPGHLLGRSSMPNVIAPAWKPDGVRETVSGGDTSLPKEKARHMANKTDDSR